MSVLLSFPLLIVSPNHKQRDNLKQAKILRRLRDWRLPYQNEFLISNNQYSRRWLFAVYSSIKDHKYLTDFFKSLADIVNPLLLKGNQANQILLIMNWSITAIPATLDPRISKVHAQHDIYTVLLSPDISTGQTIQGPVSYAVSVPLSGFHLYQKDSNRQKVRELPEYHIVSSSPFLCESGQLKNVSLMLIVETQTQRQRGKKNSKKCSGVDGGKAAVWYTCLAVN